MKKAKGGKQRFQKEAERVSTSIEDHIQEEFVVVEPNTVGHPRTVVVHLENANSALAAVMRSLRLKFLAMSAEAFVASLYRAHDGELVDFILSQPSVFYLLIVIAY